MPVKGRSYHRKPRVVMIPILSQIGSCRYYDGNLPMTTKLALWRFFLNPVNVARVLLFRVSVLDSYQVMHISRWSIYCRRWNLSKNVYFVKLKTTIQLLSDWVEFSQSCDGGFHCSINTFLSLIWTKTKISMLKIVYWWRKTSGKCCKRKIVISKSQYHFTPGCELIWDIEFSWTVEF